MDVEDGADRSEKKERASEVPQGVDPCNEMCKPRDERHFQPRLAWEAASQISEQLAMNRNCNLPSLLLPLIPST
jgi:hypothetical protein